MNHITNKRNRYITLTNEKLPSSYRVSKERSGVLKDGSISYIVQRGGRGARNN